MGPGHEPTCPRPSCIQKVAMKLAIVKGVLKAHRISLRKARGQNFLIDPAVASRIVDLLCLTSDDTVLEIGPGLGALTEHLLSRARFVLAVEIEKAFCEELDQCFSGTGRWEVLHGDILDMDPCVLFENLRSQVGEKGTVKMISNLPYCVTTPILTQFLQSKPGFSRMVLTMQREVAERITAIPPARQGGSLSIFSQYYCRVKREFKISAGSFYPSPKVESAVVTFVPWEKPPVLLLDEGLFFRVVRASFSARRKTLNNSLKRLFTQLGLSQERAQALLLKCDIEGRRRAETLTLSEFARMANLLAQWRANP